MAKTSLSDIMDRESTGTVERPKPVPVGTYLAKIKGQPEYGKTEKKGTEFIKFNAEFVEPMDDVDQDELEEWAKREDGTNKTLKGTALPRGGVTFYITEDAIWRLDEFFDHLGVLEKGKKKSEMVEDAIGSEFLVTINHVTGDNDVVYANVKSTAPVED